MMYFMMLRKDNVFITTTFTKKRCLVCSVVSIGLSRLRYQPSVWDCYVTLRPVCGVVSIGLSRLRYQPSVGIVTLRSILLQILYASPTFVSSRQTLILEMDHTGSGLICSWPKVLILFCCHFILNLFDYDGY